MLFGGGRYRDAGERMNPTAAKTMVTRGRKKIRPPVPRTIHALGMMVENYLPSRNYYQGTVNAPGPLGGPEHVHAVIFSSRRMLERLEASTEIHVDGTFKVKMSGNCLL